MVAAWSHYATDYIWAGRHEFINQNHHNLWWLLLGTLLLLSSQYNQPNFCLWFDNNCHVANHQLLPFMNNTAVIRIHICNWIVIGMKQIIICYRSWMITLLQHEYNDGEKGHKITHTSSHTKFIDRTWAYLCLIGPTSTPFRPHKQCCSARVCFILER